MDKIKKPEGKTTDVVAMLLIKQDEIIDWINNYNKQWAKFWLEVIESPGFEDLKKRVDKINDWVLEHEQARGEPKEIKWIGGKKIAGSRMGGGARPKMRMEIYKKGHTQHRAKL